MNEAGGRLGAGGSRVAAIKAGSHECTSKLSDTARLGGRNDEVDFSSTGDLKS